MQLQSLSLLIFYHISKSWVFFLSCTVFGKTSSMIIASWLGVFPINVATFWMCGSWCALPCKVSRKILTAKATNNKTINSHNNTSCDFNDPVLFPGRWRTVIRTIIIIILLSTALLYTETNNLIIIIVHQILIRWRDGGGGDDDGGRDGGGDEWSFIMFFFFY